jgi:hypothetical protein
MHRKKTASPDEILQSREVVQRTNARQPTSTPKHGKSERFIGLSKKFNRWKALIKVNGRRKELGSFLSEEEAAHCYDRHAVLAWGARWGCKWKVKHARGCFTLLPALEMVGTGFCFAV